MGSNSMMPPPGFVLDQQPLQGGATPPPPGFELDQPQQPTQPGTMDQIKSGVSNALDQYGKSQFGSPSSLLQSVPPLLSKMAGKAGQFATEQLSQPQTRLFRGKPYDAGTLPAPVAAGIGTTVAMGPDIAMSGINPMAEEAAVSKDVPDAAKGPAIRSMFNKPMLKTPFGRGQAEKAATTALERNMIPWSGSADKMFENASNLANTSGSKIGQTLQSVPVNTRGLQQSFYDLENLKQTLTQGTSGGVFSKAENAINDIQDTLSQLQGRDVTAQTLTSLKNRVGNSINYLADLTSQSDNKQIVSTIGNTIRNLVKAGVAPKEYANFLENQNLFSSAKLMQKGLNPKVGAEMGNRAYSLDAVIPASAEIAAGKPGKAAAVLTGAQALFNRGPAITAKTITEASRALPAIPEVASKAVGTVLTESKAREYLKEAGNDKEKARQMARDDGYKF